MQHLPATADRPTTVQFVFDSVPFAKRPVLSLQPEEIAAAHWLEPQEAVRRSGEHSQQRLEAALEARRRGITAYLDAARASHTVSSSGQSKHADPLGLTAVTDRDDWPR